MLRKVPLDKNHKFHSPAGENETSNSVFIPSVSQKVTAHDFARDLTKAKKLA